MTFKVLVIIPCYNEALNIEQLYEALRAVSIPGCVLTPLFINDASGDNTALVLRRTGAPFLENAVNLGIGATVQTGFLYALENNYHLAVQVDGDGQHPPEELHKVLSPLVKSECDVVIGSRFLTSGGFRSSVMRRVGIKLFTWLNKKLTGVTVKDATSGFRAYNRKAIEALVKYYPDEYPEPESVLYLALKGFRLKEVAVEMKERQGGVSSINNVAAVYYMAKVVLNILFLRLRIKNV